MMFLLTHEHVTCTLDAGGDTPQLTPKEIRPVARYARQPADAFEHPKPHTPQCNRELSKQDKHANSREFKPNLIKIS